MNKNDNSLTLSQKDARIQNKAIIFEGSPNNTLCKKDLAPYSKISLFSGTASKKNKRKLIYYESRKQASSLNDFQSELFWRK